MAYNDFTGFENGDTTNTTLYKGYVDLYVIPRDGFDGTVNIQMQPVNSDGYINVQNAQFTGGAASATLLTNSFVVYRAQVNGRTTGTVDILFRQDN